MSEDDLITALNETEANRVIWKTAAIVASNELVALKAQVNCLRRALVDATPLGFDFYGMRRNDRRARIAIDALESTTEHCLDEVKAQAISEAQLKLTPYTIDGNTYYLAGDMAMYTKQLRVQAK